MGSRGRKSGADLSVVRENESKGIERPSPPPDLTDEQSGVWDHLVSSQSADWLPSERHHIAAAYCRHVVSQRHVAQLIEKSESEQIDVAEYDKLLKMQERESGIIARLAVRLNIAHDTARETKQKKNRLLEWQ